MNEAYLKDIETKNITVKQDVGIEELMKQVTTFKIEKRARQVKKRLEKEVNKSVPDLKAKNESKIEESKIEVG